MNMNRVEILKLLDDKKIPYEITEHEAIFNMEEAGHVKNAISGSRSQESVSAG